ncbi:tRNA (N6-threonylcarbamoyladenosine(37)-N6)-methyltransferase TrmO [Thermomicrobium sp. 4228-Ro]|uniref:tRNA (N6-threonylcarbamoyladenosine(37)-N6)-methyltransferase TrmO n=1 Tax=Thermomicrobium sp. 4228-Ro TaxID=2993937 RepID=UPI002248B3D1|nr:tRNA (N6-threonylcarbamoyladenosine(37)-N6)-methyltransferase TrmO [Thermomicrobium sp. 4228-Ro]MCX2727577.1 tRNA (N6-threonylcarbamoyladenosine(37)-N6)-methyltransferase TrmO [Thermomicrobium sp. 4228-Ro]
MTQTAFQLVPIGIVHSPIADRRMMPPEGVEAEIEVFPEFAEGLLRIEENTHIWVLGWFHDADRARLELVRPEYEPARRRRGVFGLRSVARPNPIALTATRLLSVEGRRLRVARLDFVDGTPVIDLKRYSPSWDCIFAARSSRDRYLIDLASPERLAEYEMEAANFHGEQCVWVALAARLVQYLALSWNVRPKDDRLMVTVSLADELRHLADALQALTGATFGNGRLAVTGESVVRFSLENQQLSVRPKVPSDMGLATVRTMPLEHLVVVTP